MTSHKIKSLQRNVITALTTGYQPPSILSYVVAYDGPENMKTISGWVTNSHSTNNISYPNMGLTIEERTNLIAPSIDGLFVLGKGFICFDNSPCSFITNDLRKQSPNIRWVVSDTSKGSLLLLFMLLTQAVSGVSASWLNPTPYLTDFKLKVSCVE